MTLFNDPFTEMDRVMNRMMAPAMRNVGGTMTQPGGMQLSAYHPCDVIEHPDRYSIICDAPGMTEHDITVELVDDQLVVRGEKKIETKQEKEQKGVRYHRQERSFNKFTRTFVLPDDANSDQISAKLDNGVLTVDVTKTEKKTIEPKRIQVHTGGTMTGKPTITHTPAAGEEGTKGHTTTSNA